MKKVFLLLVALNLNSWAGAVDLNISAEFSSYVGLSNNALNFNTAYTQHDADGNIYLYGIFQGDANQVAQARIIGSPGQDDVYLMKLSPNGQTVQWITIIGGTGRDWVSSNTLKFNAAGEIWLAGETESLDFPTTDNGLQQTHANQFAGFLVKLNQDAATLVYGSFFGNGGWENIRGIALDSAENIYLIGSGDGDGLPNALNTHAGPLAETNGYISKLKADGSQILWSRYIGGPDAADRDESGDTVAGVVVDAADNVYIVGNLITAAAETTVDAHQAAKSGASDIYLAKFSAAGSLLYGSYFGGSGSERAGVALALDAEGNIYFSGATSSNDYPLVNSQRSTFQGDSEAVLTKLNSLGRPLFSTYIGGAGPEDAHNFRLSGEHIYVIGDTESHDFEVTARAFQPTHKGGNDAFFRIYDRQGGLQYSTFLGGEYYESGRGVSLDSEGNIVVSGFTNSNGFSVTSEALQVPRVGTNAYFAKFVIADELMADAGPNGFVHDQIGDGAIGLRNLITLRNNLQDGPTTVPYNPRADFNADGIVDRADLALLVSGFGGNSDTASWEPKMDIDGDGSETVVLDAGRSVDPDGSIVRYRWLEGTTVLYDGPDAAPSVALSGRGHWLRLEVTDNAGNTASDEMEFNINAPPVAQAGPDQTITARYGDGVINLNDFLVLQDLYGARPTEPGWNERFNLDKAADPLDDVIDEADMVVVLAAWDARPGDAHWNPAADINSDVIVSLDASASVDTDNAIDSYRWLSLNGDVLANGMTPVLGLAGGIHNIYLEVKDIEGAARQDRVVITVNPPVDELAASAKNSPTALTARSSTDRFFGLRPRNYPALRSDVDLDARIPLAGSAEGNAGSIQLNGVVLKNGLADPQHKNVYWFLKDGAHVTIHDPFSLSTKANVKPGPYEFGLLVWDGQEYNVDYAQVIVGPSEIEVAPAPRPAPVSGPVGDPSRLTGGKSYMFNPNRGGKGEIGFFLSEAANVKIVIYDRQGSEVLNLLQNTFPAGAHTATWDGRDSQGAIVPSGSYPGRIFVGNQALTFKQIVSK